MGYKSNKLNFFGLSFILTLILIPRTGYAEQNIFDIPLEDLANIRVTIASKKEEAIADSKGSLTVYSERQIKDLGYYSLEKLADITPGYSTKKRLGNTIFETRGSIGDLNAKHLLLLDGIPINFSRDYMAMAQEQIPLLMAGQIEFLRGPASSLYGVSAFNGVVGIKSKRASEKGLMVESKILKGTDDSDQQVLLTALNRGEEGDLHFSYGHFSKEDSQTEIPNYSPLEFDDDSDGLVYRVYDVQNKLRDGQESEFVYWKIDPSSIDLSFGLINMKKQSNYWESWTDGQDTSEINRELRDTWIYYLKYSSNLTPDLYLNSYFKYNNSRERGTQYNQIWVDNPGLDDWLFQFDVESTSSEALAELQYNLSDTATLIAGLNYDERYQIEPGAFIFSSVDTTEDLPFFSRRSTLKSYYAQYTNELNVLSGLQIALGVRSDLGEIANNEYEEVSPRIALIQKFTDQVNLKIMQGHAFKAPGIAEISHNVEKAPSLIDSNNVPRVVPETIDVLEIGVTYIYKGLYTSLTYFENETEDAIVKRFLDCSLYNGVADPNNCDGSSLGDNQPDFFLNDQVKRTASGIELDFQYHSDQYWLLFNVSHADLSPESGVAITNPPITKINAAGHVDFTFSKPMGLSIVLRYVDEYQSSTDSRLSGQTISDLKMDVALNTKMSASLQIFNLSDETYYQRSSNRDFFQQPKRSLRVGFDMEF